MGETKSRDATFTLTMRYAVKAEISDPRAKVFEFVAQKTMYGGKAITVGDIVYVFASENARSRGELETNNGQGLIAKGVVRAAKATPRKRGVERQTPFVTISVERTALAKRRLGRAELKPFNKRDDGRPETELNFKFYRQATNKIGGISDDAAAFLDTFF